MASELAHESVVHEARLRARVSIHTSAGSQTKGGGEPAAEFGQSSSDGIAAFEIYTDVQGPCDLDDNAQEDPIEIDVKRESHTIPSWGFVPQAYEVQEPFVEDGPSTEGDLRGPLGFLVENHSPGLVFSNSPIPPLPPSPKLDNDITRFPSMSPLAESGHTHDGEEPAEVHSAGEFQGGRRTLQDLEMNTWQQTKLDSALVEASESSKCYMDESYAYQPCSSSVYAESSCNDWYSGYIPSSMMSSEVDAFPLPLAPDLYGDAGNSLTGQQNLAFDEAYGVFRENTTTDLHWIPTVERSAAKSRPSKSRKRVRSAMSDSVILPDPDYAKYAKNGQGLFMTFRLNMYRENKGKRDGRNK